MAHPMGESKDGVLRLYFDRRVKLGRKGDTVPLAMERWYDYSEFGCHLGNADSLRMLIYRNSCAAQLGRRRGYENSTGSVD